jgi:hypothetical protein
MIYGRVTPEMGFFTPFRYSVGVTVISRQGEIYHYRRVIPSPIRHILGQREIWISLKTPFRKTAESRAANFNLLVDGVFMVAKRKLTQAPGEELGDDPREQLIQILRDMVDLQSNTLESIQKKHVVTIETRRITVLNHQLEISGRLSSQLKMIGDELNIIGPATLDLCTKVKEFGIKDDETLRLAVLLSNGVDKLTKVSADLLATSRTIYGQDPEPNAPLLSTYIEPFFCWRRDIAKTGYQVMNQERGTLMRFTELCGDKPVTEYSRSEVVNFLEILRGLPKSYGKSKNDRNKSLNEFIERAKKEGIARLTEKTVKRHLSVLSQFFRFVVDKGGFPVSKRNELVEQHRFRTADLADNQQREAWTMAELKVLFRSEIWAVNRPRDSKFWLPILALFHGGRLEEFADLSRADVFLEPESQLYGIRIIAYDTQDGRHRKLKTRASKRVIPIHPEVIRLGFLGYVNTVAKTANSPLFPDLLPQGPDGKRGPRLTRWFSGYRRKLNIYREGVGMHAFRHNMTTALNDVVQTVSQKRSLDYLTGHSPTGSEGSVRYDKGPGLKLIHETLALLQYPELDFRHLHENSGSEGQLTG